MKLGRGKEHTFAQPFKMESKVAAAQGPPIREAWGCQSKAGASGLGILGTNIVRGGSNTDGRGTDKGPDLVQGGTCHCCPYGYHIDLDFVRYCEALSNEKYVRQLKKLHRDRRKQRKSMEALLSLHEDLQGKQCSEPGSSMSNSTQAPPPDVVSTSDAFCDAMQDFEETFKESTLPRSKRRDHLVLSSLELAPIDLLNNAQNISVSSSSDSGSNAPSPNFSSAISYHLTNGNTGLANGLLSLRSRSNSLGSLSTISSSTDVPNISPGPGVTLPSQQMADTMETLANSVVDHTSAVHGSAFSDSLDRESSPYGAFLGISPSILQSIREQMAVSLNRMKELEEHAKSIPVLQVKLSVLREEKRLLMLQLKAKAAKLDHHSVGVGDSSVCSESTCTDSDFSQNSHVLLSGSLAIKLPESPVRKTRAMGINCSVMTRDIGVSHVPISTRTVGVDSLPFPQSCPQCKEREKQMRSIVSAGINTERRQLSMSLCDMQSIDPKPCQYCEEQHSKTYASVALTTDDNITCWKVEQQTSEVSLVKSISDKGMNTDKVLTHSSGVQVLPTCRSVVVQAALDVQPQKPEMKHRSVGAVVEMRNFGVNVDCGKLSRTRETGVGDCSIDTVVCEKCVQRKLSRSVGVGLNSVRDVVCDRCSHIRVCSIAVGTDQVIKVPTKSVGCSLSTIHDIVCDRCENLCTMSVGVSTDAEIAVSLKRPVNLCDKCNEAIATVAQDLVQNTRPLDQGITTMIRMEKAVKEEGSPPTRPPRLAQEFRRQKPPPTEFYINQGFASVGGEEVPRVGEKKPCGPVGDKAKLVVASSSDSSDSSDSSEDSSSSDSPDEASYDSVRGVIVHSCKDDEAIRQGLPGAIMFQPMLESPRHKYEFSSELKQACTVLDVYLKSPTKTPSKEVNSSLNLIRQEWFRVSSQKDTDQHAVEDSLDAFEAISHPLLHKIVNLTDGSGNTALHYAISYANFDVVSLLLDSKVCEISKPNKAGYTCVMLASLAAVKDESHLSVLRQLFKLGDVNAKAAQHGQTALMLAASHGKLEMVKLLLEAGADINIQDDDGSSALMCASEHGHIAVVKFLLAQPDCDTTIADNDGSTALKIAMEAGHKDIGLIIYASTSLSRGSSPYASLRLKKRGSTQTPTRRVSTPPPQTPPLPSPARSRKSASTLSLN